MSTDHHHGGPKQPDLEDSPLTHHQLLELAVTDLLIEKGVFSADDMRRGLERIDARSPALGAKLVARAWVDPAFKARVLEDANAAAAELGIDAGTIPIKAVASADDLHHVIVCTLCSCYPRGLLGLPPDWYKSRVYRSRVVREPRAVLAEMGTTVPESVEVRVHDSTAELRYIVIPKRPEGTENLSEAELEALVTRDCMIGVSVPEA